MEVRQSSMAFFRVLEAMPLRSLNSTVGSRAMVSTAPGCRMETNGWSSHPPARSMRKGMLHSVRSAVVDLAGRFACGILRRTTYEIPSFAHNSAFAGVFPSSFTTKTSGRICSRSF